MGAEARSDRASDERFVVRGKLGAGGMGVVYRVWDQVAQREVALKTLKATSARDLYRFKREFRALCDLAHPGLCTLHELHTTGDEWFFTMELVRGVSFIDWVRPSDGSDQPFLDGDGADGDGDTRPHGPRARAQVIAAPLHQARLERALGQLSDALYALHAAGKLHRDLKPSNVLVEPSGRLVVLDFGLVSELELAGVDHTHERAAVGTPVYMSPEQAADLPLDPASDWYSLGVMLYEALCGRRPFDGRPDEVMRRKQHEAPPPVLDEAPTAPPALAALCMALLAPDPRARPDGAAVLAALGREPSLATATVQRTSGAGPFVGREAQLAALHQALVDARARGVAVFVRATSGMGKSALINRFLQDASAEALILAGRCHERERVPYKTLDTLIDALTGALLKLSATELAGVLPRDVAALARLFPVLRRVPRIAEPELRRFEVMDPQETRRRAFGALRYLLGRLAALRPVIVCVDDLQWGDADSAGFLGDLIARSDRPPVLVLLVHRSEDTDGPMVATVAGRARTAPEPPDVRIVEVPPLAIDDARALVQLVTSFDGDVGPWAEALVRDAGGNTMFLVELARSAGSAGGATTLDDLLRGRIGQLAAPARALLTASAVAGRPLPLAIAARAAAVTDPAGTVALLRAERLCRVNGARVEPFHDRIRAAITDELASGELAAVHRALADAYLADAPEEPEPLVDHLLGAGDTAEVAAPAVRAAAAAEHALAFRRAADLYAIALEFGDLDPDARKATLTARAGVLVNGGQLTEAAIMFQAASELATGDARFELRRLRLEQLLRAAELREGMALAHELLAELGRTLPTGRRGVAWAVLRQRVALRVRGKRFKERGVDEVPASALREVDAMWSIASGLAFANPALGKVVQLWHLRAALALGERGRVAQALAIEIGYLGVPGSATARAAATAAAHAQRVADAIGEPLYVGLVAACKGFAAFLNGQWRQARTELELGLRLMSDHSVHTRWEMDLTELFLLAALYYLGETRAFVRLTPLYLRDAEDRGDVYSQHGVRSWRSNLAWLVQDKPGDARAHVLGVAQARADVADFNLHDYYLLLANAQIDLYVGDPEARSSARSAPGPISIARSCSGSRPSGSRPSTCSRARRSARRRWGAGPSGWRSRGARRRRWPRSRSRGPRRWRRWSRPASPTRAGPSPTRATATPRPRARSRRATWPASRGSRRAPTASWSEAPPARPAAPRPTPG
ncbi:MAG: protein kinase [Myxococcales bacterium]|nr:protein kinase [Myxococcales bacterium]